MKENGHLSKKWISVVSCAAILMLFLMPHLTVMAQQPVIPIMYYKIDVLMDFYSPSEVRITINQTVYGDAATLVERLVSKVGDEAYCREEADLTRLRLADRPLITGTATFELSGNVSVSLDRGLTPINWTRISTTFTAGAEIPENDTSLQYYITGYLAQLYTQPLVIPTVTGEKALLLPIYTLNLTAVMPPGYLIQTGGPRASYVAPIEFKGEKRILINWFARNPLLERRGTQNSFGSFYVVLAKIPPDIASVAESLANSLVAAASSGADPSLLSNASFAYYMFSLYGYSEGVDPENLVEKLASSSGSLIGYREVIWFASIAATLILLALALWKRR